MNIDFELYRIFYTVANLGNISKASEELHVSQPAISKSIKNLENQLGGTLFVRTKRGVNLTEEGKEFYKYIKQAIEYINSAENKFSELINLEAGCIRIGVSITLTKEFLLPYLKIFHELYPNIEIQIDTGLAKTIIPKLKNGLLDMMIINLNDKELGNDIEIIKCKEIHDCFIVKKDYKDLLKKKISIKDLNSYPLIMLPSVSYTRQYLDNFALKNETILKPNIELASYILVVEFTKLGLGIGHAVKEFITDSIKAEELYELPLKEEIPARGIGIAISRNHKPNFRTKKLIEIIMQNKS